VLPLRLRTGAARTRAGRPAGALAAADSLDTPIERMFEIVGCLRYGSNMCSIERTFESQAAIDAARDAVVDVRRPTNASIERIRPGSRPADSVGASRYTCPRVNGSGGRPADPLFLPRRPPMSTAAVPFPSRSTPRRGDFRRPIADRRTARPVRPSSEALGSVRLTRRGRLVILLATLAALGTGVMAFGAPAASTHTAHHAAAHRVVVAPGQTLWDIARQVAPDEDPRVVIDEIVDLNGLSSAGAIRAGQPLYVPAD
jgi:hypothetical protein